MEVLHILMGFAGGGAAATLVLSGYYQKINKVDQADTLLICSGILHLLFVVFLLLKI